MGRNDIDDMGLSLLLDEALKKPARAGGVLPPSAAAAVGGRASGDRSSHDVDAVIRDIDGGRGPVSVGSEDDDDVVDDDDNDEDEGTEFDEDDGSGSDAVSGGGDSSGRIRVSQQHQQQPQQPKYVDPMTEINEKKELLYRMERLAKKGYQLPRVFNMSSDINEMRCELERVTRDKSVDSSIEFQRKCLMMLVSGIEFVARRFFPNKVKLDGWSSQVQDDIHEYNDIFEELHDKWKTKGKLPVELRLLMTFVGGAVMCHMTNQIFKQLPGMESVLRQNPKLMKDLASATMNMAAGMR